MIPMTLSRSDCKCPICGNNMKLKRISVVDENEISEIDVLAGAIAFGVVGALAGATLGKKTKKLMYVCQNSRCRAVLDPSYIDE